LFHTATMLISRTVSTPGSISGSAMRKKIRASPAPSIRAASTSSRGTERSAYTRIRYRPIGLTMLGSTMPQIELIRCALA
jgi:hypothetical protein